MTSFEPMTPQRRALLLKTLNDANAWTQENDKGDGLVRYGGINIHNLKVRIEDAVFTDQELAQIDSRLPLVFADMIFGNNGVLGERVRCALNYLTRPRIKLPPELKIKHVLRQSYVHGFLAMEVIEGASHIAVQCDDYTVVKTPCGVKYANLSIRSKFHVTREWMDKTFLQWEKKYDIGVGLNLPPEELARFVTEKQSKVKPVSPGDLEFSCA